MIDENQRIPNGSLWFDSKERSREIRRRNKVIKRIERKAREMAYEVSGRDKVSIRRLNGKMLKDMTQDTGDSGL